MCQLQIPDHLLLVLQQARENYQQPEIKRKAGKPVTYSDFSFLLLTIAAVTLRTFDSIELYRLLSKDAGLRAACAFGQVPHRKTIARRLAQLIPAAEEQIRLCGEQISREIAAPDQPLVSAIDGRMYEAAGAGMARQASPRKSHSGRLAERRYRELLVEKRLSRLGARLSANCSNARFSCARAAGCAVDGQPDWRSDHFQANVGARRTARHRYLAGG